MNALMACRRASLRCRAQVVTAFAAASVSELDRGRPGTRRGDRGATSVEYALMAGLIALVIVVSVTLFGTNVITLFNVPSSVFHP